MKLISTRIITSGVQTLVAFYEKVTGLPAMVYTEDFAELKTANATLAFGSTRTLALFGGMDIAEAAANRSVIIEFFVDDVDKTYAGLIDFLEGNVVQPPTTMPWGNRSLLFRDPDGNLVNFFTPVAPEAKQRFNS